ncbi:ABC transporter substrate binding protein [Dechloromonas sp. ZY10]|uniref:ABC transporter substrate-binding protein n=1 Tax=Dechloromonas aquae TaxID=2664436 RepID=UPI003527CEC5
MLRSALFRALLLLLLLPPAYGGPVALVLNQQGGPYAEYARTLGEHLDPARFPLSLHASPEQFPGPAPGTELIIAAGTEALRQALARHGNTPILAVLLPRQNYEKILAEHSKLRVRISAIYLDQPPGRLAAFVRQLLPQQKRVGLLLSQDSRPQFGALRQALGQQGLHVDSEDSDNDTNLLPALNNLFARNNILLAIPDGSIYKRENIRSILVTSFRYQKPVIAFSSAFVQAGALAGLYSTPAQIARQTAELLAQSGASLPPPMPPTQFAISINQNVAESLGLSLPDESTLRRALQQDREAR